MDRIVALGVVPRPVSLNMLTVVAALLQDKGRLLICQRHHDDTFPLKWEFPGGKLKPGETPEQALVRELREELDIETRTGPELYRTRHRYAEHSQELELIFLGTTLAAGIIRNLAFERIEWVEPLMLPEYDFLPADRELVDLLARGTLRLP